MHAEEHATPHHPIHALIAERRSFLYLCHQAVSYDDLRSVFEALRRAAFPCTERAWSYIVATKAHPSEAGISYRGCLWQQVRGGCKPGQRIGWSSTGEHSPRARFDSTAAYGIATYSRQQGRYNEEQR